MVMEWTISIEGTNEFGNICRRGARIDKSDKRLRDGDLGLSIDDGKKIMVALQSAVVNEEAEAYALFRGSVRIAATCGQSRTIRRVEFEPCSARWRFAIPAGCCAKIAIQGWTSRSRRSRCCANYVATEL